MRDNVLVFTYVVNISDIVEFSQVSALCGNVSKERQERIARFRYDKDKIRCLTAELLVRYALASAFDMNDRSVSFQYTENGKPFLRNSDVQFNLSHSGNLVVCAVGRTAVGIDVEKIRQTDYHDIYSSFATSEIELMNRTKPDLLADAFYQLWTLKESYVKFCGIGLLYPFSDFTVDILPNGRAELVHAVASSTDVMFDSRKLDDRHWYALCVPTGTKTADFANVPAQVLFDCAK